MQKQRRIEVAVSTPDPARYALALLMAVAAGDDDHWDNSGEHPIWVGPFDLAAMARRVSGNSKEGDR